jgi:hypothetical protein
MLTLAFQCTQALTGKVFCYVLTPDLTEAWEQLTKRHASEDKKLPYRDLAQAFRFVLGDLAAVGRGPDGASTLLLTRREVPEGYIPRLFGEFERDLAHRHGLPFLNTLAPLLQDLRPEVRSTGRYLRATGPTGEPDIPSWVYQVATWRAIELLSTRPLRLPSGRELRLCPDTEGNLLAWEGLLPEVAAGSGRRPEQALHYLSLKPITLPGQPGLILSIDAHISRLTHFFRRARKVWLATDPGRPVLSLGFRYDRRKRRREWSGITPLLVDSFTIDGIPALDDEILSREPDRVRARYEDTPDDHPVGSGPGRKFLDVVLAHALSCLPPGSRPLELVDSSLKGIDRSPKRRKDAEAPHDRLHLADALRLTGQRLHLSVLFATDATRARASAALSDLLLGSAGTTGVGTWELIPGHLKVTFRHAARENLLVPGPAGPRSELALTVAGDAVDGWAGAVLVESDAASARAEGVPPQDDPKRQGRKALAARGLVSQYLDSASAPGRGGPDYAAKGALLDLLRSAGLTGTLPRGVFNSPLEPGPFVLAGIWSREQHNKPTVRMVSLAAVVTDGSGRPWESLGYHPAAGGWSSYRVTTAAYHAGSVSPLPAGLEQEARRRQAAAYVRHALDQLLVRYPSIPVVVFVDGVGCRLLWAGLANKTLGLARPGALPHLGLANATNQQMALVRVVTDSDELFQPVRADDGELDETDGFVPASTKLHRLGDSRAYYLVNRSRTDQAFETAARASHRQTRFEIADRPRILAAAWHAMTVTEFTVIDPGCWTTDQLGVLGGRLCGHPLAWDGRTSRPIPLHLARQAVEDHPHRT